MLRFGLAAVAAAVGLVGTLAAQPPAAPAGDLGTLQGNWKPLSIQFEGKAQVPVVEMAKLTAVFDQNEYHLYHADKSKNPPNVLKLAVMTVSLDPTTTPKGITFEFASGSLKGQKRHGIYEVAGNELKLCYGPAERPRPMQFAAPAGSGYFHEVWAKQPR
ncbi:TIGR03067 domain-containing protein [bacterium]|nr:TIGR03067 domain-containing protein [bacterium]